MRKYIPSSLKVSNRKIVYRLLSSVESTSRAEISRVTGISGATILKIIDFFIDHNIAMYEGIDESFKTAGRKPISLKFNPNFAYTIAVIIEGDYVNVGIANMAGEIKYKFSRKQTTTFKTFLEIELVNLIQDTISKSGIAYEDIIGVGLGIPGIVDIEKNIIYDAPLIGINGVYDISDTIRKLEGLIKKSIIVQNDVDACAYGEYKMNFKENHKDFIFISVGTGVGSGIVLDGKIRSGSNFFAGEIGYMCFDKNYHHKKNKSGWLENQINLAALKDKFDFSIDECSFKNSEQVLYELTDYLSLAIANIDALLNVDTVVIGGYIANYFKKDLINNIKKRIRNLSPHTPNIKLPECNEIGVVGMAALISEKMLTVLLEEE